MHIPSRLVLTVFAALLVAGAAHAEGFETIEVNKRTHKERSNNYFDVGVSGGSYGRNNFTVSVKKGPFDEKAPASLPRIEILEGGKTVGSIPTPRQIRQGDGGVFLNFQLASEFAKKCVLVLEERTGENSGNVYRVDLYSYTEEGATKARTLIDEIVKIEFPNDGYQYSLAEAAKGIKIEYKIVVEQDFKGVIPLRYGPSFREPPGPSGLHPRERISGGGQTYSLLDFGLAQPPKEVVMTLKKGAYVHFFEWDGRNWTGPSDTGRPKGKPFPAGTYDLTVTVHGRLETDNGKIPYQITRKTKLVLK